MGQQNNPFYIQPGVADVTPVMQGIGSLVKSSREKRKKQDDAKKVMEAYESGDADAYAKLVSESPELAGRFKEVMNFKNDKTEKNWKETVQSIAANPENAQEILTNRMEFVNEQGGVPNKAAGLLNMYLKDKEAFNKNIPMLMASTLNKQEMKQFNLGRGVGGGGKFGKKSFAPVTLVSKDGKEKIMVMPTFDPETNKAVLSPLDIPDGFSISKETDEEKRNANVLAKGKEVMTKGAAKRAQSKIDDGYAAANAVPEVNRAIELLQSGIDTGGWDNVALKAKQMFGIEGADEAELSQLMGKAVLKQLKPTFGAAFTETEGNKLDRLEASFGRNPKTNLRLLKNALKIYRRTAENAIRRARKSGDMDTVEELENAINFSLSQAEDSVAGQTPSLSPEESAELERLRALKAQQSGR